MKLTAKQDKFARLVAEGKEQSTAYREAYNASKMANKTIWERASFEASKDKVKARIDEYKKKFTKNLDLASVITVDRQLKTLQGVLDQILKKIDNNEVLTDAEVKSVVSLTQEQNKLLALYPSVKQKLEISNLEFIFDQNK